MPTSLFWVCLLFLIAMSLAIRDVCAVWLCVLVRLRICASWTRFYKHRTIRFSIQRKLLAKCDVVQFNVIHWAGSWNWQAQRPRPFYLNWHFGRNEKWRKWEMKQINLIMFLPGRYQTSVIKRFVFNIYCLNLSTWSFTQYGQTCIDGFSFSLLKLPCVFSWLLPK